MKTMLFLCMKSTHLRTNFIPYAIQCDYQVVLDHHHYDKLFATASIRDLAHLTALSHSSGASSGWVRAIPQSSFGLAIPGPEFLVGLCLWLEVSFFPISPLRMRLAPIDLFGDHLLECSHGDVYFQCGHPAYFNLSVCSTTQLSYTSSASSCAGVAGELAMDQRH